MPSNSQDLPLITIGTVVYNREWVIGQMLSSVQRQTYPHNKLFILIVDGESKDGTVKIAKDILDKSDFNGYNVVVQKSNIPEARNLCIKNMKGDFLLFWDSDVVMEPTAVARMMELQSKENVDLVASFVKEVNVDSADEVPTRWPEWEMQYPRQDITKLIEAAGTGHLLIAKKVVETIKFDPQLTFFEDADFSSKARKLGYKILLTRNVIGFDINSNKRYSSVYAMDIPIKEQLRGMRKKAMFQADTVTDGIVSKNVTSFFWANKRYLIYVGYVPAVALTVAGVLLSNIWLSLFLPAYFLLFLAAQIRRRGITQALKSAVRSIIVGIPTTYALLYYCAKLRYKNKKTKQ